jgi:alkanesulfonate monooxygenase SsuD/methylene tetrahydromethanopterin reductase-like flavin-dependent oxidoreductase (luciferase family)
MLMPTNYNHPARAAERIATLDLVSGGRVEWGTGESATAVEMCGFGMQPDKKTEMWRVRATNMSKQRILRPAIHKGLSGD